MKKIVSIMLALALAALMLTACGGNTATESTTEAVVNAPASALEVMENVWGAYAEDQKFAVYGGSIAAPADGKPGSFDLADENITLSLLIPADKLSSVTEAASMTHMMNANTFNSVAFRLAEGTSAEDFAAVMKDAVVNNQWICGFPETLLIQQIAGQYVVVAYGAGDLVDVFQSNLESAYPDSVNLEKEPLM